MTKIKRAPVAACLILIGSVIFASPAYADSGASLQFRGKGEVARFEPGVKLFTDRGYTLTDQVPEDLHGLPFLRNGIAQPEDWLVLDPGSLTVLTPVPGAKYGSQAEALEAAGFERVPDSASFQLFGDEAWNRVAAYRKQVRTGERFVFNKFVVAVGLGEAIQYEEKPWSANTGERLYNGIRLPEEWPPRNIDPSDTSPMPVPYLDHPPEVIPIDVGRQLFIDDFLIAETSLERTFHRPEKYAGNPVLKPETPVERGEVEPEGHSKPSGHGNAGAVPKSGGCWWDPDAGHFKLWYETSWFGPIALVTSRDGIHWERPNYDVWPEQGNLVHPEGITPDSWTVVRNWDAARPAEKWTLFIQPPGKPQPGFCLTSADGIHWDRRTESGTAGDRSTHFYNPFRQKWVYSIRAGFPGRGRARKYYECDDFVAGAQRTDAEEVPWLTADENDGDMLDEDRGVKVDYLTGRPAQLYNFDAVAYESIMLGQFQLHWGPPNEICHKAGLPKITELQFAYSRDGFHFHRPDRRVHIPAERHDAWARGYVQSLGNVCTIMGDKLFFYYTGYRGKPGNRMGTYDNSATGLAVLRRDGFASMDAGADPGTLTTRPVTFSGKRLFVNVDAPGGRLRAAVLDENGEPIPPFTLENCKPLSVDSTLAAVRWKGGADLSELADTPVRFQFELTDGSLYAFWVSRDRSGRSDGYLAGGGPGYTGATDTVGRAALEP
ncbi:glycosyl hydrolase family 32 [Kiritimatiella glycovorans]|nr:glycosyl hydrolase family 32 [Kiritimatiella glycovorans]